MTESRECRSEQLSDYLNGDLVGESAASLEAHLATCAPCRDELAELRELVARAGRLGDVEPPRDLWAGIAAAISAPLGGATVIPLPTARQAEGGPVGVFLSRRQLAAAAAVLMLASAAATWAVGLGLPAGGAMQPEAAATDPGEMRFAAEMPTPPEGMAQELESLEDLLAQARSTMDPATVRILEQNLAVIETAIEDSHRALALEPDNDFLSQHLQRAFQRKVDYVNSLARVVGWSG